VAQSALHRLAAFPADPSTPVRRYLTGSINRTTTLASSINGFFALMSGKSRADDCLMSYTTGPKLQELERKNSPM
jgi:hypothetical protein